MSSGQNFGNYKSIWNNTSAYLNPQRKFDFDCSFWTFLAARSTMPTLLWVTYPRGLLFFTEINYIQRAAIFTSAASLAFIHIDDWRHYSDPF
jgi:hypothetical protein